MAVPRLSVESTQRSAKTSTLRRNKWYDHDDNNDDDNNDNDIDIEKK
jgi:hypothetical protein